MARDLFIDLTNRRLAVSETNSAPAGQIQFTKGDNGAFNLYFLEATGIINRPFEVVSQSGTVKFGIGSRTASPESGTYTLTFGGDTTSGLDAAATAGAIQTALNGLAAISSAGGVSVTGELSDHFTVRFLTAGTQGSITADVSQLIPDTVAVIDERIAGSASVKEIQEIQLRLTPAVYQDSWSDLSTTVTATIATTVTGAASLNEVQRLSFSQKPFTGTYELTFPATAFTVASTVTSGVFITSVTHGLALNQPIAITGFDTTITGYTRDTTYFVRAIPEVTQFTVALTAGGTALTGAATTATTQGTINTFARQTAPISASASAADVQAALQALDSIGFGGVIVTGIAGQFYDVTFSGAKGLTNQPQLTVQNSTTAKPGKTANVNFSTFALRDLVGNSPSVDLDLELEITESGARSTVVLGGCSVSEELIDADSFSPTSGYPSYIFQALTNAATNATTSLVAITGLNWTAQANSEYLVEWMPVIENNEALVISGQVSIPTGSTIYGKWNKTNIESGYFSPTGTNLTDAEEVFLGAGVAQIPVKGYLKTGISSGPVSFKFSNDSAVTSATIVQTGSWVRIEKVK
jgi:hypothetical protein